MKDDEEVRDDYNTRSLASVSTKKEKTDADESRSSLYEPIENEYGSSDNVDRASLDSIDDKDDEKPKKVDKELQTDPWIGDLIDFEKFEDDEKDEKKLASQIRKIKIERTYSKELIDIVRSKIRSVQEKQETEGMNFLHKKLVIQERNEDNEMLSNEANRAIVEENARLEYSKAEFDIMDKENIKLEEECTKLKEPHKALEEERDKKYLMMQIAKEKLALRKSKVEIARSKLQSLMKKAFELHQSALYENRLLKEKILDLKGKIRVFCRMRPPIPGEITETADSEFITTDVDNNKILIHQLNNKIRNIKPTMPIKAIPKEDTKGPSQEFNFDRCYDSCSTQGNIFSEVELLVRSSILGRNVCIFAYGQTGSGKTFTMEGDIKNPSYYGITLKSALFLFNEFRDLEKRGWKFKLEVSCLEIYNEQIIDLLNKENKVTQFSKLSSFDPTKKQAINVKELFDIHTSAKANRSVAMTKMNNTSSRSHSIFQLWVTSSNKDKIYSGLVNLVDLAGSEKFAATKGNKERENETKFINQSLGVLRNVIKALREGSKHIPYRNSKLTYLLMNSLDGNSKTLMFVNISPLYKNVEETLNSLKFAKEVTNCQLNNKNKTNTDKKLKEPKLNIKERMLKWEKNQIFLIKK